MSLVTPTEAREVAEHHEAVLEAIDAGRGAMGAPPALRRVGREWRSESAADWDWFYALSKAEQSRLRTNWFSRSPDAQSPDEIDEKIPLADWLEHTRRADAARALATGRVLSSDRYGGMCGASVVAGERDHGYCRHCGRDDRMSDLVVVGIVEIADLLGVKQQTVSVWRIRKVMPEPEWTVGGRPAWRWDVIEAWAAETGRLGRNAGEDF